MARIFISPSKYVQGPGELARLGSYVKAYGAHALVVISEGGLRRSGDVISASLAEAGVACTYDNFNGECSQAEIDRLVEVYRAAGTDVVVGVGGGKIFDTAKAVAAAVDAPVVIVPTIAATDAPCSALSVIYTDDGQFKEYQFFKSNPNLVLMDTDVISKSPVRLTVSGMGDALATYFEARACTRSDATTCAGGHVTEAAMALAQLCYETLISDGLKAKLALEAGACTESVEKIIEANTLLSGLGFESAGLAGAHAIHNGMTALPETHAYYHGEKVALWHAHPARAGERRRALRGARLLHRGGPAGDLRAARRRGRELRARARGRQARLRADRHPRQHALRGHAREGRRGHARRRRLRRAALGE